MDSRSRTPEALERRAAELERAGAWVEAFDAFSRLFDRAADDARVPLLLDAVRGAARVCQPLSRFEEAVELADLSREIAMRHGMLQSAARAMNVLAATCYFQQDWAAARVQYEAALDLAAETGDDELVGFACQNLGVLANIQGDLREARLRYLESISASIRCGSKAVEAAVYNNLGMVCADLEDWQEAEVYFERGLEIARRLGQRALEAKLLANFAEPLIQLGELARAEHVLARAAEIAQPLGNHDTLSDVGRFRGLIELTRERYAAAESALREALRQAEQGRLELERGETLEVLASLRMRQNRAGEARTVLVQALRIFERLGAERDVQRIQARLDGRHESDGLAVSGAGGFEKH